MNASRTSICSVFFFTLALIACTEHEALDVQKKDIVYVFWTSIGDATVMRAELDSQTGDVVSVDTLFGEQDGVLAPSAVVADAGTKMIYWTDYAARQIVRGAWDGTGTPAVLYTVDGPDSGPLDLSLDALSGQLYWTQPFDNRLVMAPADGTGPVRTLLSAEDGIGGPWGIAVQPDRGAMYWIEYRDVELHVTGLLGENSQRLYAGGSGFLRPYGLAVLGSVIFVVDNAEAGSGLPDRILRGSTQGAPFETQYTTGVDNAYSVVADRGQNALYWINQREDGAIWKGSLDGATPPAVLIDHIYLGQGLCLVHTEDK